MASIAQYIDHTRARPQAPCTTRPCSQNDEDAASVTKDQTQLSCLASVAIALKIEAEVFCRSSDAKLTP